MNLVRSSRFAVTAMVLWSASGICAPRSGKVTSNAETAIQDRALAEALFRDGKALVEAERFEEACAKFHESQRLDPALGTLLYLGTCYAQIGKTASAWAAFQSAAELAQRGKDSARESLARQRGKEVEGRLSRLSITVSIPVEGMQIKVDDRVIGAGALSTALPFDPGSHVIEAKAPGKRTWSSAIELEPGPITRKIQIPPMQDATDPAPEAPSMVDAPTPVRTDWRPVAWATLGVGVAGVIAGSYFGLRAYSQTKDADHYCAGEICNQQGLDGHASAHTSAVYANVGFGVGLVGLAAGTYLLVFKVPKKVSTQANTALWVRAGVGQLAAGGAF